jgi:hypothetical protein
LYCKGFGEIEANDYSVFVDTVLPETKTVSELARRLSRARIEDSNMWMERVEALWRWLRGGGLHSLPSALQGVPMAAQE